MKNLFVCAVAGIVSSFLFGGCQKPAVESPVLTLETTEFTASATGGSVSVPYELKNATEGSVVSVEPVAEYGWVEVTNVGKTAIELSISKNETAESRTAEFTVSYPGISKESRFTVTQDAGEPVPAEVTFEFSVSNITTETFTYSIIPSDKEITYFHMYMAQIDLEDAGVVTGGVLDKDKLYTMCKDYYLDDEYMSDFYVKGDLVDAEGYGMSSELTYLFCFGVDPETKEQLTDVFYTEFTMESSPATLTLDDIELNISANGGKGGTYYYRQGDFGEGEVTAVSDSDWLTVSVYEDEKYIEYIAAPNDTPLARTATVTVSHPSVAEPAILKINQEAGDVDPFVVEVTDITANSYNVKVVPADKDMYYFVTSVSQAYIDENGLYTDEAIYQDDYNFYGDTMKEMLEQGDKVFSYVSASPNTAMVFYVYGVDPVSLERLTDVVYAKFNTADVEKIDVTFLFDTKVDGTSVEIGVDPQDYDGYWYSQIFETASIGADESLYDKCSEQLSMYVAMYQFYGFSDAEIFSMLCKKGPDTIVGTLDPDTEYTIAAVAVGDDLVVNSDASSVTFTTGGASGTASVQSLPAGKQLLSASEIKAFGGLVRTVKK